MSPAASGNPAGGAGLALTDSVNWAGMSHQALYDACMQGNDPGAAYACGEEWRALGAEMTAAAGDFEERISGTEAGWQGAAADSARSATRSLADWCADAGATAQSVGDNVTEQARICEAAMAKMPEPVEFDMAGAVAGLGSGDPMALAGDVQAASEQARAAHERAVEVMCEMEECATEVDCGTPECPPQPPDVAGDSQGGFTPAPLPGGPALGQVGDGGALGGAGATAPAQSASPSGTGAPSFGGLGTESAGTGAGSGSGSGSGGARPAMPGFVPAPGGGIPAGAGSAAGRSGGSGGSVRSGGSGSGGPGGFGRGAPASGTPGSRITGGPGGFGPLGGEHSTAAPPGATRPGVTAPGGGVSGRPGHGPGAPGMVGAANPADEGDIEHRLPDYLAGDRLFDLPTCAPPVIGDGPEWGRR
jgi:hypothetical protein